MRHHHVGIAVKNIEDVVSGPQIPGLTFSDTVYDPRLRAELCLVTMPDGSLIELVSGPVVERFLEAAPSPYHICYEVESVREALDQWKSSGSIIVLDETPAILFGGRLIGYVYTKFGLIEFLESA